MPFSSKAQQAAAFSGALGPEMKKKAPQWAAETPDMDDLPQHVKGPPPSHKGMFSRVKAKKPGVFAKVKG